MLLCLIGAYVLVDDCAGLLEVEEKEKNAEEEGGCGVAVVLGGMGTEEDQQAQEQAVGHSDDRGDKGKEGKGKVV